MVPEIEARAAFLDNATKKKINKEEEALSRKLLEEFDDVF